MSKTVKLVLYAALAAGAIYGGYKAYKWYQLKQAAKAVV